MTNQFKLAAILMFILLPAVGCIPSKEETKETAKPLEIVAKEPLPTEIKNTATEQKEVKSSPDAAKPHIDMPIEPTDSGLPQEEITNKLEENIAKYAGVKMTTASDGIGFDVFGPHGLRATLKPETNAKNWVFDGNFSLKTEGLQVGEARVTGISDGVPFAGKEVGLIPGILMITIPVVLPDINALETGEIYTVPVHFEVEAGPQTQFSVDVMPVGSL